MTIKDILPIEDFHIKTDLSVEELQRRLNNQIAPKRSISQRMFSSPPVQDYEGFVSAGIFEMKRIIGYKNSFLPLIKGNIFIQDGHTNIHITMKINTLILVFWYIVTFGIFVASAFVDKTMMHDPSIPLAPFKLMWLPFLVIPTLAFKFESRKSKRFLNNLLQAK